MRGTSARRSTGWSRSDRGHHQQIGFSGTVLGPARGGRETGEAPCPASGRWPARLLQVWVRPDPVTRLRLDLTCR